MQLSKTSFTHHVPSNRISDHPLKMEEAGEKRRRDGVTHDAEIKNFMPCLQCVSVAVPREIGWVWPRTCQD